MPVENPIIPPINPQLNTKKDFQLHISHAQAGTQLHGTHNESGASTFSSEIPTSTSNPTPECPASVYRRLEFQKPTLLEPLPLQSTSLDISPYNSSKQTFILPSIVVLSCSFTRHHPDKTSPNINKTSSFQPDSARFWIFLDGNKISHKIQT